MGDVGAEFGEFGDVLEAFREDEIGDAAGTVCEREQGGHLGLEVGWDSRVGLSSDIVRLDDSAADDFDGVMWCIWGVIFGVDSQLGAGGCEPGAEGVEVLCGHILDGDVSAGDGGGDGEGGGFDAVGDHGMDGGLQSGDAVNFDGAGGGEMDFCARVTEEGGEFRDFGFLCGVLNAGGTMCKGGCGEDVAGAGDGWAGGTGEIDVGAVKFGGGGMNAAIGDAELCAECSESLEVEVNGAWTDAAAAGEGDCGFAVACEEWSEEADACAHAADKLWVGGFGRGGRWLNADFVWGVWSVWISGV